MENTWLFLALASLVALAFFSKVSSHKRPKLNHPLGPKPWPIIGNLNLLGSIPHQSLHSLFDRFHNQVIDDHLAKRKLNKDFIAKDMVDILLQLAEDSNLEVKLSRDRIKGLIQDLLTGGTDTSATTVEWAVNELLKKPSLIRKVTEELDRVIGRDRWVEEDNFSKLPFLEAIIKETFRLHPVGTLLAPHYAIEDCIVAGYQIAKGTTVFINTWSIGRNSEYWDSPEKFLPERFLEKDVDMKGRNFALLPFGSGRRMCPGYNFALKLVRSMLANLLHGFNWRLPQGMEPEDICLEELYGWIRDSSKDFTCCDP